MKRYWKLIAIIPLIVVVIGTFYIKSALSSSNFPEIVFEKEQGESTFIRDIVLQGSYFTENFSSEFTLTKDGAAFNANRSFFDKLTGMYNQRLSKLQEEYRGFMRGKSGSVTSYVETDKVIGYADVINQSFGSEKSTVEFTVAVLKKKSDKATEFTVKVPHQEKFVGVYIEDVQYVDDELKVITKKFLKPSKTTDVSEEIYVYSFNMEKKELSGKEMIVKAEHNVSTAPLSMAYHYNINPNHIVVYKKMREETIQSEDGSNNGDGAVIQKVNNLISFNLKTNKKLDVNLPGEERDKEILAMDGPNLYMMTGNNGKAEIVQYDIVQSKITHRFFLDFGSIQNTPITQVDDGKLYMLTTPDNPSVDPQLKVFNIDSGETIYAGRISITNPKENQILNFYEMNIQ